MNQRDVLGESVDSGGESPALEARSRMEEDLSSVRNHRSPLRWEVQQEPHEEQEPELETEEFLYEEQLLDRPDTSSFHEWDDMDNFWNQEGVLEEMSDRYHLDDDC